MNTRSIVILISGVSLVMLLCVVAFRGESKPLNSTSRPDAQGGNATQFRKSNLLNPESNTNDAKLPQSVETKQKLDKDFVEWAAAQIAPTAATDEDFKKVHFETLEAFDAQDGKIHFLFGLLPLLEAEKNTQCENIRIQLVRTADGQVQAEISSAKAQKTLAVHFGKRTYERTDRHDILGLTPGADPPDEKNNGAVVGFGRAFKDRNQQCISINLPQDAQSKKIHREIPYNYGESENGHAFSSLKFSFAAMAKIGGEPSKLRSIILLDIKRPSILAEIIAPEASQNASPVYVFAPEQRLLAGIASDMTWLMVIDLKNILKVEPN